MKYQIFKHGHREQKILSLMIENQNVPMEILYNHAPMITACKLISYIDHDNKEHLLHNQEGIVKILANLIEFYEFN